MTWLRADFEDDRTMVSTLWCEVCRRYEETICSKKNFSMAWIEDSTNYRASNVTDHACSEQHKSAMALLTRDLAKSKSKLITTYSPLAQSMFSTTLSPAHREKKFKICYLLAKEHIPFTKYPAIHNLEERHGVDLGYNYQNRDSASNFVHYIAESQRKSIYARLSDSTNFYSILMDSSTDQGCVEEEIFVILYCEINDEAMECKTTERYYCVMEPQKMDAGGLVGCFGIALKGMGIKHLTKMMYLVSKVFLSSLAVAQMVLQSMLPSKME